jgi:N-acetylglutamate synthase and related acetyltransferases
VARAHIIPYALDGSLLLELFLHDGVGTMISYENLESLREATPDDVGGILSLIEPLESDGTLVRRGRHQIERDIDHFSVIEHDGVLFGCAALYPYPQERIGEMACLTVAPKRKAPATASACSSASNNAPGTRPHADFRAHHPHRTLVPQARLRQGHGRRPAGRPPPTL